MRGRALPISAGLLIVGLFVALLVWYQRGGVDSDAREVEGVTVRQRIEILFDSAMSSDVDRYLDCLAEPLRSRVRAEIAASPSALGRSEAKLNGLTFPADVDKASGDDATVVVEKIYGETVERVRFRLKRIDGDWKITDVQSLERAAAETKYGTPVIPMSSGRR